MTAATSFTATPPPPTTFEVGVRAELFGLKSKAELNGCFGVVTKNLLSIGRLAVKLDDGRGPYNLSAANLRIHYQQKTQAQRPPTIMTPRAIMTAITATGITTASGTASRQR